MSNQLCKELLFAVLLAVIDPQWACTCNHINPHLQAFMCDSVSFVWKVQVDDRFPPYFENGSNKTIVYLIEDYKKSRTTGVRIALETDRELSSCDPVVLEGGECYVLSGQFSVFKNVYSVHLPPCQFKRKCASLTTTQITGLNGIYEKNCECQILSSIIETDLVKTQLNCLLQPWTSTADCLIDNAICKKPNRRCRRHHPCNWVIDGECQ